MGRFLDIPNGDSPREWFDWLLKRYGRHWMDEVFEFLNTIKRDALTRERREFLDQLHALAGQDLPLARLGTAELEMVIKEVGETRVLVVHHNGSRTLGQAPLRGQPAELLVRLWIERKSGRNRCLQTKDLVGIIGAAASPIRGSRTRLVQRIKLDAHWRWPLLDESVGARGGHRLLPLEATAC